MRQDASSVFITGAASSNLRTGQSVASKRDFEVTNLSKFTNVVRS